MAFVVEPQNQVILKWIDYRGIRSTTEFFVDGGDDDPEAGGPAAIADAAQAISGCLLYAVELLKHSTNATPGAAASGAYGRHSDKLLFVFGCADGTKVNLEIGGPLATDLDTDHFHANVADTNVAALIAGMITNCVSSEGAAIISLDRAYRKRNPRIRKQ